MCQVIKANFPNNFKAIKKSLSESELESLVDAINSAIDWDYEYNTDNTDCSAAEFVESFYYGEADSDDVFRTVKELIDYEATNYNRKYFNENQANRLIKQLEKLKESSTRDFFDFLERFSSLESYNNYRPDSAYILAQGLGEIETCLSGELSDRIEQLNDSDLDYIKSNIDGSLYNSEIIYQSAEGDGWCLVFSAESLVEAWRKNSEKLP